MLSADLSSSYFPLCPQLQQIRLPIALSQVYPQLNIRSIPTQFQLLRTLTQTKRHKMSLVSTTPYQTKKNRYPQQTIYQHSRVQLHNVEKENQNGYINANLVFQQGEKKVWITQGPTDNTIKDFYNLIEQQEVDCVVMLCRLVENGKSRCANYLQNIQQSVQPQRYSYLKHSKINVSSKSLTHISYSQWPDRSVPTQLFHIHQLIHLILPFNKILIHCSAGLGRSGVIGAILMILFGQDWSEKRQVGVFDAVRKLRERRFGAVQNQEQYCFVYRYFHYLWQASMG